MVAESTLVRHQLLILNRGRMRAPNLRASDRLAAGFHPVHAPGTHPPLRHRAEALHLAAFAQPVEETKVPPAVFVQVRASTRPEGPNKELIDAVVALKRRNPSWGCPRIAQQIALAFAVEIDKDVVRRILSAHYRPEWDSAGPTWLAFLGHLKDSLWSCDLRIGDAANPLGSGCDGPIHAPHYWVWGPLRHRGRSGAMLHVPVGDSRA